MATLEDRYRICPHLRVYDALDPVIAPYLTFISQPGFRSNVVNTDDHGFRWSHHPGGMVDSRTWWNLKRRGVFLGGSFTFGVGATQDGGTLVSHLNGQGELAFLNLGIRAGNSTQEWIASIPFLESAESVILCSGLNNLVIQLESARGEDPYGPFFCEETYLPLMAYTLWQAASRVRRPTFVLKLKGLLSRILKSANEVTSRRRKSTASPESLELDPDFVAAAADRALKLQVRDLSFLSRSLAGRAKLRFAAQPFAGSARKVATSEEAELFRITDSLQGRNWAILRSLLPRLWPEYVRKLGEACLRLGVAFVDLNEAGMEGWCFVDRAHMTDSGYAQMARHLAEEIGREAGR